MEFTAKKREEKQDNPESVVKEVVHKFSELRQIYNSNQLRPNQHGPNQSKYKFTLPIWAISYDLIQCDSNKGGICPDNQVSII